MLDLERHDYCSSPANEAPNATSLLKLAAYSRVRTVCQEGSRSNQIKSRRVGAGAGQKAVAAAALVLEKHEHGCTHVHVFDRCILNPGRRISLFFYLPKRLLFLACNLLAPSLVQAVA